MSISGVYFCQTVVNEWLVMKFALRIYRCDYEKQSFEQVFTSGIPMGFVVWSWTHRLHQVFNALLNFKLICGWDTNITEIDLYCWDLRSTILTHDWKLLSEWSWHKVEELIKSFLKRLRSLIPFWSLLNPPLVLMTRKTFPSSNCWFQINVIEVEWASRPKAVLHQSRACVPLFERLKKNLMVINPNPEIKLKSSFSFWKFWLNFSYRSNSNFLQRKN